MRISAFPFSRLPALAALAIATGWAQPVLHGPAFADLALSRLAAPVQYHFISKTTWDGYVVDPVGNIQLSSTPHFATVAEEVFPLSATAAGANGVHIVAGAGAQADTVDVAFDGSLIGSTLATGLPFGLRFLPPGGRGQAGQTWAQDFPAPPVSALAHPRAAINYQFTLQGSTPAPGCPQCVSIAIRGQRQFVQDQGLMKSLASLNQTANTAFYAQYRPFLFCTILFDRARRVVWRSEIDVNVSMLTTLPFPGLMDQIVIELR
jgi:hypothetical protein